MASPPRKNFEPLPPLNPKIETQLRQQYESGEHTQAALARSCERSTGWLRNHAAKHSWKKPPAGSRKKPTTWRAKLAAPETSAVAVQAAPPVDELPDDPDAILRDLMKTALRLMRTLEQRLAGAEGSEYDTRTMANLIKMLGDFRKANDRNGETDVNGAVNDPCGAEPADFAADMARVRDALADRVDAAIATHRAAADSGGTETG